MWTADFLGWWSEFLYAISSTDRAEDRGGFLIVSAPQVNSYPLFRAFVNFFNYIYNTNIY